MLRCHCFLLNTGLSQNPADDFQIATPCPHSTKPRTCRADTLHALGCLVCPRRTYLVSSKSPLPPFFPLYAILPNDPDLHFPSSSTLPSNQQLSQLAPFILSQIYSLSSVLTVAPIHVILFGSWWLWFLSPSYSFTIPETDQPSRNYCFRHVSPLLKLQLAS